MDRIERAEIILTAAQARHPTSCLPGGAGSPADRLGTLTLTHELIAECDRAAGQYAQLQQLVDGRADLHRTVHTVESRTA